ncbi:MAG: hypothetical protein IJZ68_13070, partial [Bacteroidaceae bacterium]|nr:hypothetical protein [Bacteroidaceae bacterium]
KNTTQGMVGDFSSMLNLFLLFTNIFLRFRFLRPWGIPQLLQKSHILPLHPERNRAVPSRGEAGAAHGCV